MERGLNQPDSGESALCGPREHRFHQFPPNTGILDGRVDRDRPDARNDGTLIQAIAANDSSILFG